MLKIARDLVSKLSIFCSLESAIIDKLEDLEQEQYKIREDYKRCTAVNRSLETRYTELSYAFSSLRKDLPADVDERCKVVERRLYELEGAIRGS